MKSLQTKENNKKEAIFTCCQSLLTIRTKKLTDVTLQDLTSKKYSTKHPKYNIAHLMRDLDFSSN